MSRRWHLKSKHLVAIPLLLALMIAVACGDDATPTPTTAPTSTAVPPTPTTAAAPAAPTPTTAAVAPKPTATPTIPSGQVATPTPTRSFPTPTPTPAPRATPTATPAPAPKVVGVYGGQARLLHYKFPGVWDPHISGLMPIHSLFFNQLVEYNPINPSEIIGDLAKSWVVSDDFLSYTFSIHENAKWHDGKDLTAEDAAFSINRMIEPGAPRPQAGQLRPYVVNAEIIDRNTVRVNLKFASGAFLAFLAVDQMAMLPKHVIEAGIDINEWENIVGSGPFVPESQVRGSTWVNLKNPDYFKEGRPFFDGVTGFHIGDPGTVAAAFRTGKVDMTSGYFNFGPEDAAALAPHVKGEYTVYYQPMNNWQIFFAHTEKDPWTDPRILKALRWATDLQEFKDAFGGGIWELGAPFPFESWYAHSKEELLKFPGYGGVPGSPRTKQQDIDDAIALLKDAGYDPPSKLGTLTLLAASTPIQQPPAELWQAQMKRNLGIDMKLEIKDSGAYTALIKAGDFELGSGGGGLVIFDPDAFLTSFYGPAGRNHSRGPRWVNQQFYDWIDQQARQPDVEKRKKLLLEMEEYLLTEENPYVSWTWTPLFFIVSDKIRTEAGAFVVPPTIGLNMKQEHMWFQE